MRNRSSRNRCAARAGLGGSPAGNLRGVNDPRHDVLRRLIRGEEPVADALRELSIEWSGDGGVSRVDIPPHSDECEVTIADLATGLLRHWVTTTALREWASTVLMLSGIQFVGGTSFEEAQLVEALWAAAAGEPLDDEALCLARQLAEHA